MSSEATLMKSASMEKDSETCLLRTESAMSTRPYSQSTILQLEADGLKFVNPGEIAWTECHSLHPRNWPWRRKIYDTGVMFCFEFLTTLVSNTGSSSASTIYTDWHISREQAIVAFTSTYLLAQAIGSLIFGPYSESYGRRTLYIVSAVLFAVGTSVVGTSDGLVGVLVGRIISGMVSSVPTTVLSGSIEDMFDIKARIWAVQFWILHGIVGIALAPCYAVLIERSLDWRWTHYIASITTAINALAICFIRESRPSRILKKHLDAEYPGAGLRPADDDIMPSFRDFLSIGLKKPFVLLCTEPILLVVTIMSASVYGFAYLLTEALPDIYAGFGYDRLESATLYLFLALGAVLALLVRTIDVWVASRHEACGRKVIPEDKLLGFFIAAPLQALAFWILAWTIPPDVRNISSTISVSMIILIGFAINEFDHVLLGYIIDTYTHVAGSACAPLGALRSILSAMLPIAGITMFKQLGNNWAVTTLAIIATVYVGFAVAFYLRGCRLRAQERQRVAHEELG